MQQDFRNNASYRLRSVLGVSLYRQLTQSLRVVNFVLRPHYEPEADFVRSILRAGDVCLDIGANYGHYTRLMSPVVGTRGTIYAFEPSSITYRFLCRIRKALRLNNVTIENMALADADGELPLTIPIKKHGGLGIALAHLGQDPSREGITEMVKVTTLDAYVAAHGFTQCHFIKCDVEGAELLVLRGARQTLATHRPTLLLEIDSTYLRRHSHTVKDIEVLLADLGYRFYTWESNQLVEHAGITDKRNNIARALQG